MYISFFNYQTCHNANQFVRSSSTHIHGDPLKTCHFVSD